MTEQQFQALLEQRKGALRSALEQVKAKVKPFADWGMIWQHHCLRALQEVEDLQGPARDLVQAYEAAYPKLTFEIVRCARAVTVEVEETCIRLVAYSEHCDSMSEESLRKRRRIHHYVQEQLIPSIEKLLSPGLAQETVTVTEEDAVVDADTDTPEKKILQIGPGKEARHD